MRRPARRAAIFLATLGAGAAATAYGALRLEAEGESASSVLPMFAGMCAAVVGLVMLVDTLWKWLRFARLRGSRDVIARWRVDPPTWRKFLAANPPDNMLELGGEVTAEGIEVVVGRKGAIVGGDYQSLTPRGNPQLEGVEWLPGPLVQLRFTLYHIGRYGARIGPFHLLFPVPEAATQAGLAAYKHFRQATRRPPGIALRQPKRTMAIAFPLAAIAATAAAWGFATAGSDRYGTAPLIAAVAGPIVGSAALVFGVIAAFARRR